MTIHGPGGNKRPDNSQPSSEDLPEKRSRTDYGGRTVHEEPSASSIPSDYQPLSSAVSQASTIPLGSRLADPLNLFCFDESLINTSLQMMYQFYDDQVKSELFRSAQSSHAGQQVAITLVNFFEYLNDCKNGTRQGSAEITSQYQKAIIQACKAFCAEDTTFVATLEKGSPEDFQLQEVIDQQLEGFESTFNLIPSEAGMIPQVREPLGNPEMQEVTRHRMRVFLNSSGFFPQSSTLFIQNLMDITGLPNLGAEKIETSKMDYVLLDDGNVIARTEKMTGVSPTLQINSDGKDIPECFAKTYQSFGHFTVESPDGFVTESGEPYSGDVPAQALMTREYILKPVRAGARLLIKFYSDAPTLPDTRRIVEATEDPFTCSSLLKKAHMQASIDGILCLCGNSQEFHHKYLQKVEDGWLIFDETEQQQRKVQNLSDAFGENDKPATLVCKLLSPAQDTSAASEHDSHDLYEGYYLASPSFSPSLFLVSMERESSQERSLSPSLQTPESDNHHRQSSSPDDHQESNSEGATDSDNNESINASEMPDLPVLPARLHDKLKEWQSQQKSLSDIWYLRGLNRRDEARPEYPIPALPGLKPEIKSWTPSLMSYVIHQYQFDEKNKAGKAFHNSTWHIHSLKVLREDSQQYLTMLGKFFDKEWQSFQSVPSLYYRLVKNQIPIPPLQGIPPELHGTTNWNEQLIADLLVDFCNLQESPLSPHPLVHEIIRCINNGHTTQDLVRLQNKRLAIVRADSAPGILPPQNDGFRQAPQKWGKSLIRYLTHLHLDFIKERCSVELPKDFTLSDVEYLTLFDTNHQEFREALKRLTIRTLNNKRECTEFFKAMAIQKLKPNRISWCPMADECWGMGALNNLARHFGLIPTNPEMPEYESFITDILSEVDVSTPNNVATRLNRKLAKNPAFKPPMLEKLAEPPQKWTLALVKVFVKQKFSGQAPVTYRVLPEDILQVYAPDSPEYLDALKQYLQTQINTAEYLSFQGLLDFLNSPVKGREFRVVTPFITELPENQRGAKPWTRDSLQAVINGLGLRNAPQNKGSAIEEIVEVYLFQPSSDKMKEIVKRLNRKTATGEIIPVPDELKSLLKAPNPAKWSYALARLSIAMLVRNTPELQSSLPEGVKVKKEDIDQLIKPECRHLLPSHLKSMV